ncbi:MAG: HEAT repeat domain-containing protein [Isosphaeraceae bacterium]
MSRAIRNRWAGIAALLTIAMAATRTDAMPNPRRIELRSGETQNIVLGALTGGQTYRLLVAIVGEPSDPMDRVEISLEGVASDLIAKTLHAGDPDVYLAYRPARDGAAKLRLHRADGGQSSPVKIQVEWTQMDIPAADRSAFEAEPNDSWQQANELVLGRDVYGSADDVDYLDNRQEGRLGLDWFRFEVAGDRPILVYFQLELLDRDVSANMRVFTVDPKANRPAPYLRGKDPMEVVHDRERERYSKHLSRTFTGGTYYLEVNANHPDYILRTRVLPVPPYGDPHQAVEAGMHYIMNVGDAWFAQIPREGHRYVRAANLHEIATRCTACHASSFSTEANLVAHRNGYPIRSKSAFQYVVDRLYHSPTPLYGNDGLYWQRFIAIPLESQGRQGGILLDHERQIAGRPSPVVERFGPFLRAAWESRTDLPEDEFNGVIPLDSKFGLAWRDWRVLDELAQRTGRADYRRAPDRIATIVGERASDLRAAGMQDRIQRLHAWWLIDREKFANKIRRETGRLLRFQNSDGGWPEGGEEEPGPSAVYTTGQLVSTLLRIGLPRDHPAIQKALRYLLAQQQDFGGWIQTTTHETFRTPMRETQYAVMALAEAFPLGSKPQSGWGNRDEGPAHRPRRDSLVHTLDDLENLWDVPAAERGEYARAIEPLLDDSEPLVRAAAAACLGRLDEASSAPRLAARLSDPSKIVWRSAAWALRRIGNEGRGHESILAALTSPDAATRRGAARVFAYHFYGMDESPMLIEPFFELTKDPDLLTRLQAIRTLRQVFYRTADTGTSRRVVQTYLARMSEPQEPVVSRALSENLYILLDENLGGGVSLQKNVAELPETMRGRILEARRTFERDALLTPVFAALREGDDSRRIGVLRGFDGSFFKGRTYARVARGQIDVGNDREFGFLYRPPLVEREATFRPLLNAELPPTARRQAVQLAAFFNLPEETRDPLIRAALERRGHDPDPGVRIAALAALEKPIEKVHATEMKRADVRPRPAPGPPGLATFRERINPLFYRPGEDGYSCADCHGNHTILRIAPAFQKEAGEDAVTVNYRSVLKVIDLDASEKSLLLRKAISPLGQGEADPASPTGLTHIGGPRWSGPEHAAYQTILDWIRGAPDTPKSD